MAGFLTALMAASTCAAALACIDAEMQQVNAASSAWPRNTAARTYPMLKSTRFHPGNLPDLHID
jgi:hypothetical protein